MAPIFQYLTQAVAVVSLLASSVNAATLERRMTYRDNDVKWRAQPQEDILSGQFTIQSLSITDGQDPDSRNMIGTVKGWNGVTPNGFFDLEWKQHFMFSVGRKKSSKVAHFWNTQIAASQNTFNHGAGELNFAFNGELKLDLANPSTPTGRTMGLWQNIGLAQGNSASTNNWWIGGRECRYKGDGMITCPGVDANDGRRIEADFKRGSGNDHMTIDVSNIVYL